MNTINLHNELKEALRANRQTLVAFAASLQKPDGSIGVSHTAVIRVAQGREATPWIRAAIKEKIRWAKKKYPEYYRHVARSY